MPLFVQQFHGPSFPIPISQVKNNVLKVRYDAPGAGLSYGDEQHYFEHYSRKLGYYDVLREAEVKQFNCETKLV